MKTKSIFIISTSVIVLTAVFCIVFANASKCKTEIGCVYTQEVTSDNAEYYNFFEDDTTEGTQPESTTAASAGENQAAYRTTTAAQTTSANVTKAQTTAKSKTQNCIEKIAGKPWKWENGNTWIFDKNGNFHIYDSNQNHILSYTYVVNDYKIDIYTDSKTLFATCEYDCNTNQMDCIYLASIERENASDPIDLLNNDNAFYYLSDAIEAYNGFVHTGSNNFEFDHNDTVYCPHCADDGYLGYAYRLTNFSSLEEIEDYINANLTGCAQINAISQMNELIDEGMICEGNGNLYVCEMFNLKGYNSLDAETVEIYAYATSPDESSCVISVKEYDFDEEYGATEYYYIVVYENGRYKISSDAYLL